MAVTVAPSVTLYHGIALLPWLMLMPSDLSNYLSLAKFSYSDSSPFRMYFLFAFDFAVLSFTVYVLEQNTLKVLESMTRVFLLFPPQVLT